MKIYESEKSDGIADLIKSNASIACLGKAKASNYKPTHEEIEKLATKANANPGQFDLFYLDSILVSTGWNLNDDVFDPDETWNAKSTPVDKQFNYMHDETDIIGHITSSSIIVDDKIYEGDEIPDSFHIVEGSVLYRVWNDTKLQERMDSLISEIEEGKWYVSMECLFSNFDYAMVDSKGVQSVVKRTKTTAYLSKHLRAYGGSGSFDGYKVGRLLRNITFSGKGLVNEPANPNSVILSSDDVKTLTKSFRACTTVASKQWEKNMNEEQLKAQAAELTKQLDDLKAQNKVLAEEVKAKAEKEHSEKVAKLDKSITELTEQVTVTKATVAEKEEAIANSTKKLAEVQAELDKANKEVESLKASIKKAQRVAELTKAGVVADKHEDLITKFANVSDDIFAEFVALHAAQKTETVVDDKAEAAKAAKEAADALEKAKADKVVPVSVPDETDKTKEVRSKASSWLAQTFKSTAHKNIRKTSQEAPASN